MHTLSFLTDSTPGTLNPDHVAATPNAAIQPYHKAATDEDALLQLEQEGVLRPTLKAGVIRDKWKPLAFKGSRFPKDLPFVTADSKQRAVAVRLGLDVIWVET